MIRPTRPGPGLGAFCALAVVLHTTTPAAGADTPQVADGRKVGIEYTLKLEDGSTASSNVGAEPLYFTQGGGEILPALQRALVGLRVNDTKQIKLSPEDGYGPVNPDAFITVGAEEIPVDARQPGAQLVAQDESGEQRPVRVHEVREQEVVLDVNHPLAGQTLLFDIKILSIE